MSKLGPKDAEKQPLARNDVVPDHPTRRTPKRPDDIMFYDDPLSVSIQNEHISPEMDRMRKEALAAISPDYRSLVQETENSKLKTGPVLLDEKVQGQVAYASSIVHTPYFIILMIIIQTILFAYSYYLNYSLTGSFSTTGFPFLVQNKWVLVLMGARYYPCMRPASPPYHLNESIFTCAKTFNPTTSRQPCTLPETCGLGPQFVPNQFYRLATAIFLHSGIIHFLFNVVFFQFFAGIAIERDIGTLRMAFIYLVSGIGGFLFTPVSIGKEIDVVTVGASGAIYGLISCILTDLIFSWKLLKNPKWELTKLLIKIAISLMVGLLPQVDNLSHFGGLISGLLSSALVLPSVHFGNWDRIGKKLVRIISFPLLVAYLTLTSYAFVTRTYFCSWCRFLNPQY